MTTLQVSFVTNDGKNAIAKVEEGRHVSYTLEEEKEKVPYTLTLPFDITSLYAREDFVFVGCDRFVFLMGLKMLQEHSNEFIPCVISGTQACTEISYREHDRTIVTVNQDGAVKEWTVEFRNDKWRMIQKILYE